MCTFPIYLKFYKVLETYQQKLRQGRNRLQWRYMGNLLRQGRLQRYYYRNSNQTHSKNKAHQLLIQVSVFL